MSIKKYETFLNVIKYGSLTKAAKVMGHTQSGITHIIHSLEEDLGLCLMTRNRNGIVLTEAGKELLPMMELIVNADIRLSQTVKQLKQKEYTTIRIGTFTSVAVNWLPTIMKEFQYKAPEVRFELADGGYDDIINKLSCQEIDIGFITLPIDLNCKCISLYEDRLLAVVPPENPLSGLKQLPVSYFETEPTISLMEDTDRDARTILNHAGIKPNIKFKTKDDYAMIAMVEKNLGICIVPELLLQGTHHHVTVMELDPPAKRTIGIAIPSYEKASPMVQSFADFIVEWVRNNHSK